MVKKKLYTVSILFTALLAACGEKQEALPEGEDDIVNVHADKDMLEIPEIYTQDPATDSLILGSWRLSHVDGKPSNQLDGYKGITQSFLKDKAWIISMPSTSDSATLVEGGKWDYDPNAKQLSLYFTADSIPKTLFVNEIKETTMELETPEGMLQTWKKISDVDEMEEITP